MKTLLVACAVLLLAGSAVAQSSIFFSEYIEGSSNNKAVEIYNNTTGPLDLTRVSIERWNNGNCADNGDAVGFAGTLAGTLAAGDVWVIANASADAAILGVADDVVNTSFTWYNGDDVLLLFLDGVLVDSIGRLCEDPGSSWGTDPVQTGEDTLVRFADNCSGDTDPYNEYDPADAFMGYAQNDFSFLGFHDTACQPVGNEDESWGNIKAMYR